MRRLKPYLLLAVFVLVPSLALSSPSGAGSTSAVRVPHGWRSISYGGVTLDVPKTWPTVLWVESPSPMDTCTGSIDTPTVLIGPPPPSGEHMCPARSVPLAAVVNVGADVVGSPPPDRGVHIVGTVEFLDTMKPTEINGLRLYLGFEQTSVQTSSYSKKRDVDIALVYVPVRQVWVFVSVGTSHSLPGGAPGRAMEIVHTIRTT